VKPPLLRDEIASRFA